MNFEYRSSRALLMAIVMTLELSCSVPKVHDFQREVTLSESQPDLLVANPSLYPVRFKLKLDDRYPRNMTDILKEIESSSIQRGESRQLSAWRYVAEETFHASPLSESDWVHDPTLFLNSIGSGHCDDRAAVLASIWKAQGFSARVVGIEGHVVPTVESDRGWEVMDPDHGVVYLNGSGDTATLAELESKETSVSVIGMKESSLGRWSPETGMGAKTLEMFRSTQDNVRFSDSSWQLPGQVQLGVQLPPEAKLIFVRVQDQNSVAAVELTSNSVGQLNLPLALYGAVGKGTLVTEHGKHKLDGVSELSFPGDFVIESVENSLTLYFHTNPKMLELLGKTSIRIEGSDGKLAIEPHRMQGILVSERSDGGLFWETMLEEEWPALKVSIQRGCPQTRADLSQEFQDYLARDKSLSASGRTQSLAAFWRILDSAEEGGGSARLSEYFPQSILVLFIGAKYNALDKIQKLRSGGHGVFELSRNQRS